MRTPTKHKQPRLHTVALQRYGGTLEGFSDTVLILDHFGFTSLSSKDNSNDNLVPIVQYRATGGEEEQIT
jgi:hypothetical protein